MQRVLWQLNENMIILNYAYQKVWSHTGFHILFIVQGQTSEPKVCVEKNYSFYKNNITGNNTLLNWQLINWPHFDRPHYFDLHEWGVFRLCAVPEWCLDQHDHAVKIRNNYSIFYRNKMVKTNCQALLPVATESFWCIIGSWSNKLQTLDMYTVCVQDYLKKNYRLD